MRARGATRYAAPPAVRVRSSDQTTLAGLLRSPDVTVTPADGGALAVTGLSANRLELGSLQPAALAATAGTMIASRGTRTPDA